MFAFGPGFWIPFSHFYIFLVYNFFNRLFAVMSMPICTHRLYGSQRSAACSKFFARHVVFQLYDEHVVRFDAETDLCDAHPTCAVVNDHD